MLCADLGGWPHRTDVGTLLRRGRYEEQLYLCFAFGSNVMHALMRLHPAPEPPLPRPYREYASLPPHIFTPAAPRCTAGVKPAILDDKGNELEGEAEGILAIKQPWPSTLRTVYGDHQRYQVGLLSRTGVVMLVVESEKAALDLNLLWSPCCLTWTHCVDQRRNRKARPAEIILCHPRASNGLKTLPHPPVSLPLQENYFAPFPGYYFTGDGARRDADGYYWM